MGEGCEIKSINCTGAGEGAAQIKTRRLSDERRAQKLNVAKCVARLIKRVKWKLL
jgi:hypothetical protein